MNIVPVPDIGFSPDIGSDIGSIILNIGTYQFLSKHDIRVFTDIVPDMAPIPRYCKKYRNIRISGDSGPKKP
jgi:hypothetical protein